MIKRPLNVIAALAALALTAAVFCGCAKSLTLHNGFFGITVTVTEPVFVDYAEERNMSAAASATMDPSKFLMESDAQSAGYYNFVLLSCERDPEDAAFAQLYLSGEVKFQYPTVEDFYAHIAAMEVGSGGVAVGAELAEINGTGYTKLAFMAETDDGRAFLNEYYIIELPEIYLYIYLFTWENSHESRDNAEKLLRCVTVNP